MPIIDARKYRTLLICPNRAMASELGPVLAHGLPLAPVHILQAYPGRKDVAEAIRTFDPRVCFLDFSTDQERAFFVADDVRAIAPNLPLVALLEANDQDLVLKTIRHGGAADFLIRPFTIDQVDATAEKIARISPAPADRPNSGGKVVVLVPVKGACGATTLSCNLAYQFKKQGTPRVLLADLDPYTGTISFVLKTKTGFSFLDVVNRADGIDSDLWRSLVTTLHGVDVILSPEHMMEGLTELEDASMLIDFAQRTYDTVVVDLGSAYGSWSLSAVRLADEILLVTTNELPALQAAQRVMGYFEQQRIDASRMRLVVNRYHRDMGLEAANIPRALQTDVFSTVPADYESVQRSLMDGKPIPASSAFGKAVATLATQLGAGRNKAAKESAKGGGLLRMFGKN